MSPKEQSAVIDLGVHNEYRWHGALSPVGLTVAATDITTTAQLALADEPEDRVMHVVVAHLSWLPEPLRLRHGPLLVTIETWSDGVVQARWPETTLFGEGESDVLALDALRERIAEFARDMVPRVATAKIGGPLLRQWKAFGALVDLSSLGSGLP